MLQQGVECGRQVRIGTFFFLSFIAIFAFSINKCIEMRTNKPSISPAVLKLKGLAMIFCGQEKYVNVTKKKHTIFFLPILNVFAPPKCMGVHYLVLKNNSNYMIFLEGWYSTSNTSGPPWEWCLVLSFFELKQGQ